MGQIGRLRYIGEHGKEVTQFSTWKGVTPEKIPCACGCGNPVEVVNGNEKYYQQGCVERVSKERQKQRNLKKKLDRKKKKSRAIDCTN